MGSPLQDWPSGKQLLKWSDAVVNHRAFVSLLNILLDLTREGYFQHLHFKNHLVSFVIPDRRWIIYSHSRLTVAIGPTIVLNRLSQLLHVYCYDLYSFVNGQFCLLSSPIWLKFIESVLSVCQNHRVQRHQFSVLSLFLVSMTSSIEPLSFELPEESES
jgi:hypothetical protein